MTEESAGVRIAVVDDERMLLSVFSSLMRRLHYHADFFSNPVKALETVIAHPARYDLVILDIRMPELSGIAFAKRIRYVLPDLPIIFMTAYVTPEVRDEAAGLGNVVFLEKPFPLEETLKETIPKFLMKRH